MNGDQDGNILIEILEDTFLTQIITQLRREIYLLNLILVSDSNLKRECQVGKNLSGCNDHLIRLEIKTDREHFENRSKIPDCRGVFFWIGGG